METAIFNNVKVNAFEFVKKDGELKCECCSTEVIFKNGNIIRAHFAHKNIGNCIYKENESEEHVHIKNSIYKGLRKYKFIENLEMEKYLGDCISDVYFEKGGMKYAIEIQLSDLTEQKIIERNLKYEKKGIHVLWVHSYHNFLNRVDLKKKEIKLKAYESWLATMNYGTIYLWNKEEYIIPVIVKRTEVREIRTVKSEPSKSLALDFFGVKKEEFNRFPALFIMRYRK